MNKITESMVFDKEMIEQVYAALPAKIEEIKSKLQRPLTLTEKILYAHLDKDDVLKSYERGTDYVNFNPDRVAMQDATAQMALLQLMNSGRKTVAVPSTVHCDHLIQAHISAKVDLATANDTNREVYDFLSAVSNKFGIGFWKPGAGIIHQVVLENYAFPGGMMVGTDSHTPHVDALGVIAVGVGGLEAENVMLGNPSYMRVPEIIGVNITGVRSEGITATDIALAMTSFLRQNNVISAYLEFYGSGIQYLNLGDRATIANMTPEYGASAGMFAIDEQTIAYLTITGREASQVKLVEAYAKANGLWADAFEEATYARTIEFNLSEVTRSLAGPSKPHKLVPTTTLKAEGIVKEWTQEGDFIPDGGILIAAITSCTNTSNPRNVIAAGLLAKKANELGLTRKPWVKSSLAPGSKVIEVYLKEAGLLTEMEKLGFGVVGFACTTCNGMSGALDPVIQQEVVDRDIYTTAVLSGNRNFDGRIHPYVKEAFLASPALVIAYALAGTIRFDIENDVLGKDKDGNDIKLKDLWPTDAEINAVEKSCVRPEMYNNIYEPMFARNGLAGIKVDPFYKWNTNSTYINKPPYWEDEYMQMPALKNMRALGVFPDNITTDHLSPSNAILPTSASGEYCLKMGLPVEDLNSYATHRGDHHTASRATLANPKLFNEMVKNPDGSVKQGSLTMIMPEAKESRMWEAIETYTTRKQPLIIIAGTNYGQGSSRDWAAKGVRLAGVEVLIAESIERIHRTNLVGMGVLPLQFKDGETRFTYAIDGTEVFDIEGTITPRCDLTVVMTRANGEVVKFDVLCRLDTSAEVDVYTNGGILQKFAKDVIALGK